MPKIFRLFVRILSGLFFVVFFVLAFDLSSQTLDVPGYIITLENDTIYGYFNNRSEAKNFKRCEFSTRLKGDPVVYEPGSIAGYRVNESKYYISKVLYDSDTLFVEYLVNGVTDLYYYKDFEGPHYLVENEEKVLELTNYGDVFYEKDGKEKRVSDDQRIGMLNYYFSDCTQIQSEIETTNFSHKSLISLTKDYHRYTCKEGEECIVYEKKIPAIRLGLAPVIGYYFSDYEVKDDPYLDEFVFEDDSYPAFGIAISLNPQRFSDNFSVQLEALMGHFSTTGMDKFRYGLKTEYHSIYLDYDFLKMMIPVSYSFPTGKLKPDILFGGGLIRTFNPDVNRTIEIEGESYYTVNYEMPRVNEWYASVFARIGASYHFNKRMCLFLNAGYEFSSGMSLEYATYMKSFSIHSGFYF
jgi:hypothetical protein